MLVTGFIVNLFSFLFGSSLVMIIISLVLYALIIRFILLPLCRQFMPLALSLVNLFSVRTPQFITLDITPPTRTDTTPQATGELLGAVYHLLLSGPWYERLLSGDNRLSLELVASKSTGIRYVMRLPKSQLGTIETLLQSYQPDINLEITEDYLPARLDSDNKTIHITSFAQTGYFAYPLRSQAEDESHDLIGYLAGAMTKLREHELMAFQIVLQPSLSAAASRLRNRLLVGDNKHVWFLDFAAPSSALDCLHAGRQSITSA